MVNGIKCIYRSVRDKLRTGNNNMLRTILSCRPLVRGFPWRKIPFCARFIDPIDFGIRVLNARVHGFVYRKHTFFAVSALTKFKNRFKRHIYLRVRN